MTSRGTLGCVNTFVVFKILCLQFQREKNLHVTCIRSDHGKEFENTQFSNLCQYEGIHLEFSTTVIPQENGVMERKNRTL